jgi:GT2 family glycosyltransferase
MGWNRALKESDEISVLVNSDCMFSPGWLENLVKRVNINTVVTSKLIERRHPKHGMFERAIEGDYGDHPDRFKQSDFIFRASCHMSNDTESGGAYMPCALYRENAIKAGLYPEGNPKGSYGDREFFERLLRNGVKHITSLDSIVYHFKEGEMSE